MSQSVLAIKGAMVICDLLLVAVLLRLLRRVGIPAGQILIYAWNPLVVSEVAGNGHVDVLAVLFLITGIHLIIVERSLLSTIALGLAAGAKLLPILAFPILARRLRARFWFASFVVLALFCLPYASAGAALFRGLGEYAARWRHNDSLFSLLLRTLELLDPTPLYTLAYPVTLARILAFLLALLLAGMLAWKRADPIRGSFLLLAGVLLLSPTVHPWYLLWIAPFLALRPSRAWILLTGLVPLSYLNPGPITAERGGNGWASWAEYLPFFALLLCDAVASWRRKDPVTLFGLRQFPPGLAGTWPVREHAGIAPSQGTPET
jgi:hypothetical protein